MNYTNSIKKLNFYKPKSCSYTKLVMSSIKVNTTNNTTTATPLQRCFAASAQSSAQENLKNGSTWNGDVNFSSLGPAWEAKMLALDQKMVTPDSCLKNATLDPSTLNLLNSLFDDLVDTVHSKSDKERAQAYGLLFRYLFYVRALRNPSNKGESIPSKRSRLLFYHLFARLYEIFPETCKDLISLMPEFGYFGDLDNIIMKMNHCLDVGDAALQVYRNYLNDDCMIIWGKPLKEVTCEEASALNQKLKKMTSAEVRQFVSDKCHTPVAKFLKGDDNACISLAAKWFTREGKKNSEHRDKFLCSLYFNDEKPQLKSMNYAHMRFRNIISALTQCIQVGETMMCEQNPDHRRWADIPLQFAPAAFMTKYRKALANEKLKETVAECENEVGNRFPENADRVQCRKNLMDLLLDGKLKGAAQDIDRLSKIIFDKITRTQYGIKNLSPVERQVIAAQWKDLVTKLKEDVNTALEATRAEAIKSGTNWLDPRNVIPVVDTSGSMVMANVADKAIGLGVLASHLSTMPGCLISFSDKPEVFSLDMSDKADVFDHFATIANGPMGYSTNIDGTYDVLLKMMKNSDVKDTDFALLFLTDGQFDSLVKFSDDLANPGHFWNTACDSISTASDRFSKTFLDRLETRFKECGYNLPRTIFWNLNCASPGFPATSISRGVQLVSGYSQSLMLQVFTGDYKYELQADGTYKVNVSPWESFLASLLHPGYDQVTKMVASRGEGCLKHLVPANSTLVV